MSVRKSYSIEYKKEIVEESQGKNLTAFCKERNLDLRMVRKWRSDYEKLGQKVDEGNAKKRKCGSGRKPLFPELEDLICEWVAERRARGLIVRRADIQTFALKMQYNSIYFRKTSKYQSPGWMISFSDMNFLLKGQQHSLNWKMPILLNVH